MIHLGTVTTINRADNSGAITDKRGREFFFSIQDCCENELPTLHSKVTFVKDKDYLSTNVATLIKISASWMAMAGSYNPLEEDAA